MADSDAYELRQEYDDGELDEISVLVGSPGMYAQNIVFNVEGDNELALQSIRFLYKAPEKSRSVDFVTATTIRDSVSDAEELVRDEGWNVVTPESAVTI